MLPKSSPCTGIGAAPQATIIPLLLPPLVSRWRDTKESRPNATLLYKVSKVDDKGAMRHVKCAYRRLTNSRFSRRQLRKPCRR